MRARGLAGVTCPLRRKPGVFYVLDYVHRSSLNSNVIISSASLSSSSSSSPSSETGGKREKRLQNSRLALYSQLAKFRLSSLVVMTSGAGYACYGAAIDPLTFGACTIGTAFCAGSANAFNQAKFLFLSLASFLFFVLFRLCREHRY